MANDQLSPWAQERFGSLAEALRVAVPPAILATQELALAAHVAGAGRANDIYGTTVHVKQYDELSSALAGISGITVRKLPEMRRFALPVVEETAVVLYPWCYAKNPSQSRPSAKMRPSDARRSLLSLSGRRLDVQLTLDTLSLTAEELEELFAAEEALRAHLADLGRVVVIAYACNPRQGVYDLGWGDAEMDLDTGEVDWSYWEDLPLQVLPERRGEQGTPLVPLPGAGSPSGGASRPGRRFDDVPLDDDFDLRPQNPLVPSPDGEPDRPRPATGDSGPDDEERPE